MSAWLPRLLADQHADLGTAEPAALGEGIGQQFRPSRSRRSDRQLFALRQDVQARIAFNLLRLRATAPRRVASRAGLLLEQARQRTYLFGQSRFLNGSVNLDSRSVDFIAADQSEPAPLNFEIFLEQGG